MSLILHSKNRTLVVQADGELDLVSAQKFRETVDRAIEEMAGLNLIIDLSKITFIDSSGLGVILGRYRLIRAKNGELVLCGMNKNVNRVLEMSGLLSFIHTCESVDAAWKIISDRAVREA